MNRTYYKLAIVSAVLILLIAAAQHNPYNYQLSDATKGFLAGIQIGLMALPIIVYKKGKNRCAKNVAE